MHHIYPLIHLYNAIAPALDSPDQPDAKIYLKKNILDTDKYIKLGVSVSDPIVYRQNLMDSLIQLDASIKNLDSKLI